RPAAAGCDQLAVPAGLPDEFTDYLRGALAWHRGRLDDARAAWEALLARPVSARRRRTTWATFMLGRLAADRDPAAAIDAFPPVRTLVVDGFPDSAGLAAASLGREARMELERGDIVRALHLYREQLAAGDPGALVSLRLVCRRIVASDRDAMVA